MQAAATQSEVTSRTRSSALAALWHGLLQLTALSAHMPCSPLRPSLLKPLHPALPSSLCKQRRQEALRYILSFGCPGVFYIGDQPWVRTVVVGQSFMLHQIRKMVGGSG